MFIRYYGRKGEKGVHEELIIAESEAQPWLENCYALIFTKTRWVLDHLESLPTFRVVSDEVYKKLLSKQEQYFAEKKKKFLKEPK